MLKADADIYPDKTSWVTLVRDLLSSMGFYEVWLSQGVGDMDVLCMFLSNVFMIVISSYGTIVLITRPEQRFFER